MDDRQTRLTQVLIVDDDPRYTEMLAVALEVEGFLTERVHDPRKVHEMALAMNPDVIVTDVAMPDMDGFTMAAGLKSDRRTAQIPLLFVSATGEPAKGSVNFDGTDVNYLMKPFSMKELVSRIRLLSRQSTEGVRS
ncbi:response regulator [bacterium]|nr:response regulator [bacterium]